MGESSVNKNLMAQKLRQDEKAGLLAGKESGEQRGQIRKTAKELSTS